MTNDVTVAQWSVTMRWSRSNMTTLALPSGFVRVVALAITSLVLSCGAGEVTLNVVIPREAGDILYLIDLFQVQLVDGSGASIATRETSGLGAITFPNLHNGRYTFLVSALDSEGQELLLGQSVPLDITRQGEITSWVLLAPLGRISKIPTLDDATVLEDISARCGLVATRIGTTPDHPDVLFTGGLVGDEIASDGFLYTPGDLRFKRTGSMICPRAGHSAILTELDENRPVVIIAGGGVSECVAEGRSTSNTFEIFNLDRQRFELLDFEWIAVEVVGGEEREIVVDSPNLSQATMAKLREGQVLLTVPGEAWLLDVFEGIATKQSPPSSSQIALQAITLTEENGVAVLTDSGEAPWLDIFDPPLACNRTSIAGLGETGNLIAPLQYGGIFITSDDRWWTYDTSGCQLDPSHTQGALTPPRHGHTATTLSDNDGRVLIVGGGTTTTSLFLPRYSRGNPTPAFRTGPVSRHEGEGHETVLLADETVLIVGCGEEPEIFSPRREFFEPPSEWPEIAGVFNTASRPSDAPPLRVAMAVDASDTGEYIRLKAIEYAPNMISPEWGDGVVEIGVISTDLDSLVEVPLCPDGSTNYPEWVDDSTGPIFVDPGVTDRDVISQRIQAIHDDTSPRCDVQQPLMLSALMGGLTVTFGADFDLYEEINEHPGPVLFVAQMGVDDRSMYSTCDVPGEYVYCDDTQEWLLSPEGLSQLLIDEGRDGRGYEVILLYDDGNGETCAGPERLTSFGESLGPTGAYQQACTPTPEDVGQFLLSRVRTWAFRQACVPHGGTTPDELECQVSVSYLEGDDRRVELLEPGTDWTLGPSTSGCCSEPPCSAHSVISISPEYTVPGDIVFERFEYVCW